MFPLPRFSSPAAPHATSGHHAPDTPLSHPPEPPLEPGRHHALSLSPQTPPAAPEAAAWSDADRWRMSLRDAMHGRGRLSGRGPRLDASDAAAIRAAMKAVPAGVLLPGEDGMRRAAIEALKLKPLDRLRRRHDLSDAQSRLVQEALQLGDACMRCGPLDRRRPRSSDEMAALQRLTTWAGTGPENRHRAALVAAVRAPRYRDGVAEVRWQERSADPELHPLALPPATFLAPLLHAADARPRLVLNTYDLRADASVDAESPLFSWRTLRPQRLPTLAQLRDLPTGVEGLDLRDLDPELQWSDIAPLLERLPGLLRIDVDDEQLMQPPAPGWRLDIDRGRPRFVRVGAAVEGLPHASFNDFTHTLQEQLQALELNGKSLTAREHRCRLKRLQRHMNERPMPPHEVLEVLQRETGNCLEVNLMRLDELLLLARLGGRLGVPEVALLALRDALTHRARQTSAHCHPGDAENVEIGAGLAWAVDRRMTRQLDLEPLLSRPVYPGLARLPGHVRGGDPVNDEAAADALIAAEVDEAFPTVAELLCWNDVLATSVAAALDRDADFRSTRAAIEASFQRDYQQAVERSTDPLAGSEAFQRREEALRRARFDRLVLALQPALSRLRDAGVLPAHPASAAINERDRR